MRRLMAAVACGTITGVCVAGPLSASIQKLIDAEQNVIKTARLMCDDGDSIACDKILVAQAHIILLHLELRHQSGKVRDALDDVDDAISDLEDAIENQ
jgi:hypothetical protein